LIFASGLPAGPSSRSAAAILGDLRERHPVEGFVKDSIVEVSLFLLRLDRDLVGHGFSPGLDVSATDLGCRVGSRRLGAAAGRREFALEARARRLDTS
jgi:hypothetical protein